MSGVGIVKHVDRVLSIRVGLVGVGLAHDLGAGEGPDHAQPVDPAGKAADADARRRVDAPPRGIDDGVVVRFPIALLDGVDGVLHRHQALELVRSQQEQAHGVLRLMVARHSPDYNPSVSTMNRRGKPGMLGEYP